VRVIDDEETDDGNVFIVMELLEGETLSTRLTREGPLSEAETMRLGVQVLEVLEAAHACDVVHRDIKPENIFLTETGEVKVLDFGIARLKQAERADVTKTGSVLGSVAYMPPEQAGGRMADIDAQTDIWALGASMFRMLTGSYVHDTPDTPRSMKARVRYAASTPAPSVRSLRADISAELANVIDRALAFDKCDRWSDAHSMLAALRALLDSEHARVSSAVSRPSPPKREHGSKYVCRRKAAQPSCRSGWLTNLQHVARCSTK
jgi:serine/threonine-protein kinase